MTHRITIDEVIPSDIPLVDVRTPAEFARGHIPGGHNLPLFTNEERVLVGTTYKQTSREAAILLGFELTGPKWAGFIREALETIPSKRVALHCWRGGMRSAAMGWALDLYGFEVYLIDGGYRSYRRWVARQFGQRYPLQVIGGLTGSGKTQLLRQLRTRGEQVIDLEDMAQHKGSAYGSLNKLIQPSQEQFENDLAARLASSDRNKHLWVEDESLAIGKRLIPRAFWDQIQTAPLFDLERPPEERVDALVREYGGLDKEFLVDCTDRIRKRLGPEHAAKAIAAIREGHMDVFVRLVLVYYDKAYRTGLKDRQARPVTAAQILDFVDAPIPA